MDLFFKDLDGQHRLGVNSVVAILSRSFPPIKHYNLLVIGARHNLQKHVIDKLCFRTLSPRMAVASTATFRFISFLVSLSSEGVTCIMTN